MSAARVQVQVAYGGWQMLLLSGWAHQSPRWADGADGDLRKDLGLSCLKQVVISVRTQAPWSTAQAKPTCPACG